ncbi:MAG: hypothetical protein HC869_18140 [Rhodospirillales bacterium]|nr:hypothetical protein [Rhodospirillales bacterium]
MAFGQMRDKSNFFHALSAHWLDGETSPLFFATQRSISVATEPPNPQGLGLRRAHAMSALSNLWKSS